MRELRIRRPRYANKCLRYLGERVAIWNRERLFEISCIAAKIPGWNEGKFCWNNLSRETNKK